MFQFKDKEFYKRMLNDETSPEEIKEHLIRNYSVYDLADALTDTIIQDIEFDKNTIILSNKQSQLLEILLSRLIREKHTGLGRKPKSKKYLEARENINPDLFIK